MKIGVGIPVYETVSGDALGSLLRSAGEVARLGSAVYLTPVGVAPHDRARMLVTNMAAENGCDYLLFIDADTIVPVGGIKKLFDDIQNNDCVAVSGHYYRRGYPYTSVWCVDKGEDIGLDIRWSQVVVATGLHEIGSSGLGCCLIDLPWILTNLEKPYYHCPEGDEGSVILDDVYFFNKIRNAGGKILGDADVRCGHVHTRVVIDDDNVNALRVKDLKSAGVV